MPWKPSGMDRSHLYQNLKIKQIPILKVYIMIDKNMDKTIKNPTLLRVLMVYIVIILVTLSVYLPVNDFDFVNYDDDMYVLHNPRVLKGLTFKNILWSPKIGRAHV